MLLVQMGPTYEVLYEPTRTWMVVPGVGVAGILFGLSMALRARRIVYGSLIVVVSVLCTLWAYSRLNARYQHLRSILQDPAAPVVEGAVEDFDPAPFQGHKLESFRVAGVTFAYSDYIVTGGFNTTRSHGGPVRPGLRVRIHYLEDGSSLGPTIIKLEAVK
jgi:hypothetical protein